MVNFRSEAFVTQNWQAHDCGIEMLSVTFLVTVTTAASGDYLEGLLPRHLSTCSTTLKSLNFVDQISQLNVCYHFHMES